MDMNDTDNLWVCFHYLFFLLFWSCSPILVDSIIFVHKNLQRFLMTSFSTRDSPCSLFVRPMDNGESWLGCCPCKTESTSGFSFHPLLPPGLGGGKIPDRKTKKGCLTSLPLRSAMTGCAGVGCLTAKGLGSPSSRKCLASQARAQGNRVTGKCW